MNKVLLPILQLVHSIRMLPLTDSCCYASPSVLVVSDQLDGLVTYFPCMPVYVRHGITADAWPM